MCFDPSKLATTLGLVSDLVGAYVLARGLIISRKEAIELGVTRFSGDTDEDNLELPQVKDRVKQSFNAKIGVIFLILGSILQMIGTWL